jgi:hypothetical protein
MNNVQAELISDIKKSERILEQFWDYEKEIKSKNDYIESIQDDLNRLKVYDDEYWSNMKRCDCRLHNQKCTRFDPLFVKCRQCQWTWYFIKK